MCTYYIICRGCYPFGQHCLLKNPKTAISNWLLEQCSKKVTSDSPGLVDFALRLVNCVLNLPEWQVKFFREFKLQKNWYQSCSSNYFFGLVKMTLGLVHANYSLLEWQAVKLTFFAPCKIAFITCVNRLISIYSFSYLATRLGGINQRHYKYYPLLRLMRSSFVLCPQA